MTDPSPVPPPEPFAYMSDQRSAIPKIREPVLEILFAAFFVVAGVVCLIISIVQAHRGVGNVGGGIFVLVLFVGGGAVFGYIGARRLRWKRAYRRVMGRNPW
jgi:hypothetical protein